MSTEPVVVTQESLLVREPIRSVQSRVSWGALLAGAAVALAVYALLTMLGIAVGFTVSDRFDAQQVTAGTGIWSFVCLLVALFLGGWVVTQCTVGENRTEAVLYGVIVWGITLSFLLWFTAVGLTLGFGAVMADRQANNSSSARGLSPIALPMVNVDRRENQQASAQGSSAQDDSRRNNTSDSGGTYNRAAQDAQYRDSMRTASWWTFGGMLVSLLAAICGALMGPYELVMRRDYRDYRGSRTTAAG